MVGIVMVYEVVWTSIALSNNCWLILVNFVIELKGK